MLSYILDYILCSDFFFLRFLDYINLKVSQKPCGFLSPSPNKNVSLLVEVSLNLTLIIYSGIHFVNHSLFPVTAGQGALCKQEGQLLKSLPLVLLV